uniref:Uncharacterized protein n=1 Tax=Romanomermis culicivorax TaxID=13658 RepID=A0A915I2L5_ROMCU
MVKDKKLWEKTVRASNRNDSSGSTALTKPTVLPIWCPTIPCIKNHHCATCIQCALKSKLWNCVIVNIEPKQRNSTMPAPMSANSPKKLINNGCRRLQKQLKS